MTMFLPDVSVTVPEFLAQTPYTLPFVALGAPVVILMPMSPFVVVTSTVPPPLDVLPALIP